MSEVVMLLGIQSRDTPAWFDNMPGAIRVLLGVLWDNKYYKHNIAIQQILNKVD